MAGSSMRTPIDELKTSIAAEVNYSIASALSEVLLYPAWLISVERNLNPILSHGEIINRVYGNYGPLGFYTGVLAGVAHRTLYNFIRARTYKFAVTTLHESKGENTQEVSDKQGLKPHKTLIAVIASGIAALAVTPFQTIQNTQIFNPKLTFVTAVQHIFEDGGYFGFFRGTLSRVMSSMLRNLVALYVHPPFTELIRGAIGTQYTYSTVGMLTAAVLAAAVSAPFEFAQTYLQTSPLTYTSFTDCWYQTTRDNGIMTLWVGFLAQLVYRAPRQLLSLFIASKVSEFTEGALAVDDAVGYTRHID